jgi:hypothetical protein
VEKLLLFFGRNTEGIMPSGRKIEFSTFDFIHVKILQKGLICDKMDMKF